MILRALKYSFYVKSFLKFISLLTLSCFFMGVTAIAAGDTLSYQRLTDRLTVISGTGGNVVLFNGEQGTTLVDSGSQENNVALLELVDELTDGASIEYLFNTHWHEDHTGGNEALYARGAQIIAHENTKLWLGADFDVDWRQTSYKPRPKEALPSYTFYVDGQMDLGGEVVQYFHIPQAHTDGDIFLYFPDSNVMVAGGLLTNSTYPTADIATGGWLGGVIKANQAMLEIVDEDTLIVPAKGMFMTKADLQRQLSMLQDLYDKMKALTQQGFSGHDMLEEKITAEYDSIWGSPEEFILETYRGMWAHTYDMGGFI